MSVFNKIFFPLTHFFTSPARYCIIINGQTFIRNNEVLIDTNDTSKALAGFAGANGIVKTEKINPELMYDAAASYSAIGDVNNAINLLSDANKYTKDEKLRKQIADEMRNLK